MEAEDFASRFLPRSPPSQGAAPPPPWRAISSGGRLLLVSSIGAGANELGEIAALAARCDALVLPASLRGDAGASSRRRAAVARMMGVRHLVLAMDDSPDGPDEPARFAEALGFATHHLVLERPEAGGDVTFAALLKTLPPAEASSERAFRMIVDEADAEGVLRGPVLSGRIQPGDAVVAAGSGRGALVVSAQAGEAAAGESAALRLDRDLGAGRGTVLAAAEDRPESCDQFAAQLLWLGDEPLLPGRPYGLRLAGQDAVASVTRIKHRIEGGSAAPLAAGTLRTDDRGQVNLSLSEPIVFEPFERDRALGSFVLTDRRSGRTVAAGTIDFALRRAANIHRQATDVSKAARAAAKRQRPALLWFTGLSGAGKSTIANLVEQRLFALGHHTYLLDGDNVRHGLNRDLGFTAADRVENIRRVAETAKLMVDAGLITLASFISPFRAERQLARDLLPSGEFIEIFVDAPLSVAEGRDPKGLYAQARAGRIPNFTGIDSPYEAPEAPELHLRTHLRSAEDLAEEVVAHLRRSGFLTAGGG